MGLVGWAEEKGLDNTFSPSHMVSSAPTGLPAVFVAVWVSVRAALANTG